MRAHVLYGIGALQPLDEEPGRQDEHVTVRTQSQRESRALGQYDELFLCLGVRGLQKQKH